MHDLKCAPGKQYKNNLQGLITEERIIAQVDKPVGFSTKNGLAESGTRDRREGGHRCYLTDVNPIHFTTLMRSKVILYERMLRKCSRLIKNYWRQHFIHAFPLITTCILEEGHPVTLFQIVVHCTHHQKYQSINDMKD
jgi:hypothetical protein